MSTNVDQLNTMSATNNNLKVYIDKLSKKKIATTFDAETITGLSRFMKARGFIAEPDAIRFIVHAVLVKEGHIKA
jgi:hypothetical protein